MTRRPYGVVVALLAVVLTGLGAAWPAPALAADEYVLFYTVTSAQQGRPETLDEIAERLLGDSGRAVELFNRNSGRKQPDGGALSDPATLTPGWYIVLPWDAVGPGVRYGVLPSTAAPAGGATPEPPTPSRDPGGDTGGGTGQPGPGGAPASPSPAAPPAPKPAPPGMKPAGESGTCVTATAPRPPSDWATTRLAPDRAWTTSRGVGQVVALIDSGVDATREQFGGRVLFGVNVVTGEARGDTDCTGTGTAMAGLIAARQQQGDTFAGLAPEALIMPVRVVTDTAEAQRKHQATAIQVAISAGVTVIALGSHVDTTAEPVAEMIEKALARDIVVVAGAPAGPGLAPHEDVISVGGVGPDGTLVEQYAAGTVDVVAPGADITSLGAGPKNKTFTGDGTRYAVAAVAGEVALVRSAFPALTAAQVAHRVQVTAERLGDAQPDGPYGSGMINPAAAVTTVLPEEAVPIADQHRAVGDAGGSSGMRIAFILTVLAGLALSTLLVFRVMRSVNRQRAEQAAPDDAATGSLV